MRKGLHTYAIYKGDELIAMGNIHELTKQLGIKPNTIYCKLCPSHIARTQGKTPFYRKDKNRRIVIKVDDEDE